MTIEIVIDNPGIYGPGDIIKGKVICTFHSQEHIRGIKCRFRGEEETHWNQRRGKHNVHFSGKNILISANNNFIGEGYMIPGRYEYPFAYSLLAADIPSSFTHQFGSVRYHIEALVDRPFAIDYRTDITLHVVAPISLIQEQNRLSLNYQAEKVVGSCVGCCVSGIISLDVSLEKTTFSLGETMNFQVHLVNGSDIEVEGLKVELSRNIEFTANKPSTNCKIEKYPIAISDKTGVRPKDQKTYSINFVIPETTIIYSFRKCLLLKQWFTLNVTAILPIFHSNLMINTLVELGHVIFGTSNLIAPAPTVQTVSTNNFVPVGQAPPGEIVQPPPSYDDIMKQH